MNKIDIHKDYIMFCLMSALRSHFHTLIAYMQQETPYGKEYENAYWLAENIQQQLNALEEALSACVERKEVK